MVSHMERFLFFFSRKKIFYLTVLKEAFNALNKVQITGNMKM